MMESKHKNRTGALIKKLLIDNVVTILFVVICIAGIILANQPLSYVIGEISTRLFRNLILILALLVPVVRTNLRVFRRINHFHQSA